MIGNGPFNRFRKPHVVYVVSDSHIERGVIKPGLRIEASANFSVQSIKNTQEIEGLKEGRRLTDWRRLYSDTKIPLLGDEIFFSGGDLSNGSDLLSTADGGIIRVGAQVGSEKGLGNPAIIVIDGFEYEFFHREPWQNGLINHYKYYVVRKTYG